MARSDEEIEALWQKHGKSGILNIINSQTIVDKRDVARLKQKIQDEESKDESETLVRRETREEETLSIARKALEQAEAANLLASEANSIAWSQAAAAWRAARYAMYAAIIAAVAAIAGNKDAILSIMFN